VLFPSPNLSRPSRVVVTGVGIVSPLGNGWKANAAGFQSGRIAIRPVTLFDVSRQRVKVAAQAVLPEIPLSTRLEKRKLRRLDRGAQMLLLATQEAWTTSGWEPSDNLPFVLGTTSGGMSLGEDYYRQATQTPGDRRKQASRVLHYQAQQQALSVAAAFGFGGPITIIANACASGANGVGHAWELVRRGRVERALGGGYDALSQLVFAGFDSLQALSPTECRPFDARRDGLALGEGAAVLALESLESAKRRNANILAEIVGYGAMNDLHHLTQPQPEGNAAFTAMTAACAAAEVPPDKINYINAHGTGTPLNDSAEAAAINRWAGPHASKLPVSSTKSGIGHLLGAAGAVETVICVMALCEQWIPPTITIQTPEPQCAFPVVRKPMESKLEYVLTNSFGFGGANASLILRRWA
jgi:3-oxoacyl-[acyl-carrier-protein] synthase II